MDRLFTEAARKKGVGKYSQWYKGQYKGKDKEGGLSWLVAGSNIGPGDVTVVTGCEELRGAAKVDVKEDVM